LKSSKTSGLKVENSLQGVPGFSQCLTGGGLQRTAVEAHPNSELLMNLNASGSQRPGGKVESIRAVAAGVDLQPEGVHVTRLERMIPGVQLEFAGSPSGNRTSALNLSPRLAGDYQEVQAAALE